METHINELYTKIKGNIRIKITKIIIFRVKCIRIKYLKKNIRTIFKNVYH